MPERPRAAGTSVACADESAVALWYHDAVYDPSARDNEERSARMFEAWAADVPGLGARSCNRIAWAILDTTHGGDGELMGAVSQYAVDADLSILGESEEVFDAYDRAIRREYDFVPEDQYRAGRTSVLGAFLARPRIYATEAFRGLERPARANLERAVAKLRGAT